MKVKPIVILLLTMLMLFAAACDSPDDTSGQQSPAQSQEQTPEANATGGQDELNDQDDANNQDDTSTQNDAQRIGEGAIAFIFEVTDSDGNVSIWNVHTDETTVGAALVGVGLIEGEMSDFGLMVSHVNGLRADFVEDDAWWAFYVNGEMAMVGVDSTDIEEGASYAFVYTPA
ncbi:MAG: DUF4430 domain-containing protein [Oscillospiraceae bacterium]|nr:DUF4430 domain-containing protein [Oscillospiraceae bacterium]